MNNPPQKSDDDLFQSLLGEYERRKTPPDTLDWQGDSEDPRRRNPNFTLSLSEIRTLFDNGQARAALSHIEDYLQKFPDDTDALLLKAEICLELGVQTTFVGKTLSDLVPAYADNPAYQRLAAGIEQAIREKLETGRNELGYRFNESLREFGIVADYATTDPSAIMAVVLALLKHIDLSKQAVPATSKLRTALDRFTLLAMERSQPGTLVHEEAIRYKVYLMLHEGQIDQAAAWLQSTASYAHHRDHLQVATHDRAIRYAIDVLAALLRNGQLELSREIIQLGLEAAPNSPTLHYYLGELALIENRPYDALAMFEAAERCTHLGNRLVDGDARQQSWALLTNAVITCPTCGKVVPPTVYMCTYCNKSVAQHELMVDRYHLTSLLETDTSGLLGEIGQAHTLYLLDQPATAAQKLAKVLPAFADNSSIRQELNLLHAKLVVAHAETPTSPADDTLPDLELDLVRAACHEIEQWLAQPMWNSAHLLALRGRFLPPTGVMDFPPRRLPLKLRQSIIKRLIKASHLELARDLMPILFAENHQLKSVQQLADTLEAAITAAVEERLHKADELLDQGMAEQVLTLCEDALALYPDHPVALSMRGRARRQLGADLAALDDFYQVIRLYSLPTRPMLNRDGQPCPFLRQTRILAAETLEQRWETTQALELLEGLEGVEDLRQRIERRRADLPAVRLLTADEVVMTDTLVRMPTLPFTHAFFAIAVRSAGRMNTAPQAWVERVLMAGYEFMRILGGLRNSLGQPVFALRLISTPHPQLPERGQLQVALLARISAEDDTSAEQMARQLWLTLKEILPLRREYAFSFEPVVDETELDNLMTPFDVGSVAEIARREDMPSATNERYAVYPYTPALSLDLHNLCYALLRQPAPAMVSLHLLPTTLMAWERTSLDQQMVTTQPTEPLYDRENVQYDRVATWWQETPRWGQAQANRYLVDALSLHAYILQVNVVGSAHMNPLLPEQVAAALFGPPRTSGEARYGGYEIVRASRQDELTVACRNLATLDVERWVYSAAPESAPRLRYLVTENEAAVAFRLPIPGPDGLPGIPVIEAKPVPPPNGMPSHGTLIGESLARVAGAPARIIQSTDDRRRHVYIVGKTGTGKSTLIKGMALQDIEAGHGVCVVDPHGDLIDDILLRIPPHRANDVIVFNPADEARPIGLNLLAHQHESERHQVVNEFIGLLMRLYDPGGSNMIVGPRFQHNVRMAMLTAMSVPGSTLIEVVRALSDNAYVKSIMPHVTDPIVRLYWEKQIAQTSDFHKSEVLDYIVSKFSRFTGDKRVRNIIGQSESTVDFRHVMDNRQVLLVNLSKGKIGPENAQFLGLLMVQQLLLTALSRADLPVHERPDFYLYVDEFQNFATEMFGTMLSEGRKYGVALTIANQYLTQLPHAIREAIFGNVGSIISFRLGTQDATALAPELYPVFNVDDLLNLPRYTASVKLLVDGLAARPFTMRTVPDLHAPNPALADAIRDRSRTVYGRDESVVTEEVLSRLKARG